LPSARAKDGGRSFLDLFNPQDRRGILPRRYQTGLPAVPFRTDDWPMSTREHK